MALAPDGPLDGSAAIKVAAEVLGKVLAESEETLRGGAARAAEEALAEKTTFTNKVSSYVYKYLVMLCYWMFYYHMFYRR